MVSAPIDLTRLLHAWNGGDEAARDAVVPLIYTELRNIAAAFMKREQPGHTFSPTDLANESYLRLIRQNGGWKNRDQFFALAAQMMRRILVDHARAKKAAKRGGALRVTLVEAMVAAPSEAVDLVVLDDALEALALRDERQARLVELRFFGGLSHDEAAEALGISVATAKRDWAMAKAWLYRHISSSGMTGSGQVT
jgi:RNA polymerase sigma factor (TIGR02999 family)